MGRGKKKQKSGVFLAVAAAKRAHCFCETRIAVPLAREGGDRNGTQSRCLFGVQNEVSDDLLCYCDPSPEGTVVRMSLSKSDRGASVKME